MIQENNRVSNTKKGKGKLPLFCGNREWVIPIYSPKRRSKPTKIKLVTMKRFYVFGRSLFAYPHTEILIKNNVKENYDKGNIWGAFYRP